MKDNLEQNVACARAEDLVAYLYGEAGKVEARDFEHHMEHCDSCRSESVAFSRMREDIIEWRNLSLPSFDFSNTVMQGLSKAEAAKPGRSALLAMREFFSLSPLWMRGATAAAVIVFCALIVFTVARFNERPTAVVKVTAPAPTEAQLDQLVRERMEELRRKKNQEAEIAPPQESPVELAQDKSVAGDGMTVKKPTRTAQAAAKPQKREKPGTVLATQEARQQLAELVQTSRDEDELPRLSDLIEDSNEPQ